MIFRQDPQHIAQQWGKDSIKELLHKFRPVKQLILLVIFWKVKYRLNLFDFFLDKYVVKDCVDKIVKTYSKFSLHLNPLVLILHPINFQFQLKISNNFQNKFQINPFVDKQRVIKIVIYQNTIKFQNPSHTFIIFIK